MKSDKILENELRELMERRMPLYKLSHITVSQNNSNEAERLTGVLIRKIEKFEQTI
jgi:shikimate kinase